MFTFGYGGRQVYELTALVAEYHAVVIDVRLKPWTKQPGWSVSELKAVFAGRYHWWRELGNTNYDKGGKVKLLDEKKGIAKLVKLVRAGESVILLCGERDPTTCHRTVIARMVVKLTGATVVHLPLPLADRTEEQLPLWPRTRAVPKLPRLPANGSKRTRKRPRK